MKQERWTRSCGPSCSSSSRGRSRGGGARHLSQPALTASIRRLEAELGASVLERGRRGATPTAAGQALVPRARAALAAIDDARRAVREVAGVHAGDVRLGAGATAVTYLLPAALAAFRGKHPAVRFFLREAATPEVARAVEAGELDLGVVTPASLPRRGGSGGGGGSVRGGGGGGNVGGGGGNVGGGALGLETDAWFLDELVLVAAPRLAVQLAVERRRVARGASRARGSSGAGAATVGGAAAVGAAATVGGAATQAPQLASAQAGGAGAAVGWDAALRFVTFPEGATTRELLERSFPGAEVVMELGSIAAVKGNVRAGIGVALVSRSAVVTDLRARRLVEVPHPATPVLREMHLLHRGVARLPPAAAALRAMLLARPPERPARRGGR
ncbi:MAG: LysR substrate-binding domain-containing protein [Polyangiaceae bacterium]